MEKIKNFLLSINFAVTIFVLIGLRIAIVGASIGDALALFAVCSLQAFYRWSNDQKIAPLDEKVSRELEEVKSHLSSLMIKNTVRPSTPEVNPERKRYF